MSLTDALSPTLTRLRMRYAQSSLPTFFGWWATQLRACLPPAWRAALQVRESEVWLRCADDAVRAASSQRPDADFLVIERAPGVEIAAEFERLASEDVRARRRVLLLPAAQVLRRRLQLPAAARDNLRAVLGFELDRQTPFRADQVHYDYRLLAHDPAAKTLPVELALLPKESMQGVLAALGGLSRELDAVDVAVDGRRLGYNLLPAEQRRRRVDRALWLNLGLVALSALFLLLAMSELVANRQAAVEALQAEADAQRDAARGVTVLRDELEEAVAGANFLAVRKTEQPNVVAVLDALTTALPDDTFLERMNLSGSALSITGQSAQAPRLIELLGKAPGIRELSLAGAIQPDARSGKDRFNINAQVVATPREEARDATTSGG
ncbi:MAG: PilN domain-containing protein [Lysobacteraceae bacterium]